MDDFFDGGLHEFGGIQRHFVLQPVWETLRKVFQCGVNLVRHIQGIGTRLLVDDNESGVLILKLGPNRVILAAEVRTADVFDARNGCTFLVGTQDDVLKLFRLREQPGGNDGKRLGDRFWRG